jgi:hypothetical protein
MSAKLLVKEARKQENKVKIKNLSRLAGIPQF